MSDHWIEIIPRDPHFVPPESAIVQARTYVAELAPAAEKISSEVSETVEFRGCGENFESVRCPVCAAELAMDLWGDAVGDQYDSEAGFVLRPVRLPCGHEVPSPNDLRYEWEQGFSRFALDAMNPSRDRLEPDEVARLEAILECPVKVIYRHI